MAEELTASGLKVVDAEGRVRARLGTTDKSDVSLVLYDTEGTVKVALVVSGDGRGHLHVGGRPEGYYAFLGELGTGQMSLHFHGDASIFLCDAVGNCLERVADTNSGEPRVIRRG